MADEAAPKNQFVQEPTITGESGQPAEKFPVNQIDKEIFSDKNFFEETRDHIKHEDQLIHYRMSWLIALQAFLFSAYGFSLSAQATVSVGKISNSLSAPDTPNAQTLIDHARVGFALIGVISSGVILLGIIAAIRSMTDLVEKWNSRPINRELFPQIIGNYDRKEWFGHYLGLMPVISLPPAFITVWAWIELNDLRFWLVLFCVLLAAALLTTGIVIGFKLNKVREKPSDKNR